MLPPAKSRARWVPLVLFGLGLSLFLAWVVDEQMNQIASLRAINSWQTLWMAVLVSGLALSAYRWAGINAIYGILAAAGGYWIVLLGYFSPVDECCHFAYIDHVMIHRALPRVGDFMPNEIFAMEEHIYPKPSTCHPETRGLAGTIYQAVHPPLYHTAAAFLCSLLPGNLVFKLYLLKFLGLGALLGFAALLLHGYRFQTTAGGLRAEDALFFSILFVICFSPGLMVRMVTLSNLHLALVLCGLFYAFIQKYEDRVRIMTPRLVLLFGLLTGAINLTHFFNLTLVGVGCLFFALRGDRRWIPTYLLGTLVVTGPWLAWNFLEYGHLTGWTALKPMMMDAVNRTRMPYGLTQWVDQISPRLVQWFWNPEECRQMQALSTTCTQTLGGLGAMAYAVGVWRVWSLWKAERRVWISETCGLVGLGLNVLLLGYITLTESVPTVLGRYLFYSLWPIVFLLYRLMMEWPPRHRYVAIVSMVFCGAMLWANYFCQSLGNWLRSLV